LVLYALELPAPAVAPPRVGVVSSRKLGGAVQRNRARRLIREAWRLHRPKLNRQNVQLVLAARVAIVGHPRQAVDAELGKLLAAAGLIGS
jgi:ribonuclease P protein component